MITTLLWDVDGTLLDFIAAEKAAIRKLFREYHLGECTDKMLARYSKINRTYWVKLENGEMTKPEILVGRFHDFLSPRAWISPSPQNLMKNIRTGWGMRTPSSTATTA